MKLDLSSLGNAIGQLEDAVELSGSDLAKSNNKTGASSARRSHSDF